jgi:RNA polymerase sigma factor (sigma-70 family)
LLARYGRTSELRQELPGEIYYQFCRLLDSYDLDRGIPLSAYLARMLPIRVFNFVQTYWRQQNRHVSLDSETLEAVLPDPADGKDSWAESLYTGQILNALPGAIAALPHRQRLVLVWRYYDERSFEEIANDLGIQPVTARSLLRYAIKTLRTRMVGRGMVEQLCSSS